MVVSWFGEIFRRGWRRSGFYELKERSSLAAGALSGGERQMLAIGMALMVQPQLLLLDEPSAGLGPAMVEEVFEKVQEINRRGIGVLMVEQNAWESLQIAHRAYLLVMGKNLMDGTGKEFWKPRDRESFLGIRIFKGGERRL
jgi:branched-chain amino acid transport system ATP-binding protein